MNELLSYKFLGNTMNNWLLFVAILVCSLVLRRSIALVLRRVLFVFFRLLSHKNYRTTFDDLLRKPMRIFVAFAGMYAAVTFLKIARKAQILEWETINPDRTIKNTLQVLAIIAFAWVLLRITDFVGTIALHRAEKTQTNADDQIVIFVRDITKIVLLLCALAIIGAYVFNFKVTALIGGLGIGGLAVALAAQDTLSNLMGSFTIFLDKPFALGDTIDSRGVIGTVERIGFRSTRIRTLDKSFVTIPNRELVNASLNNISKSTHRRANFKLQLDYKTLPEKIKFFADDIRHLLTNHPETSDEVLVRFMEFGEYSLNITVTYLVNTNDYDRYAEVKEQINYKIFEILQKHGIKLALPSRNLNFVGQNAADSE
jgi:MscS family membrane protein